jgi:hypothetical protein
METSLGFKLTSIEYSEKRTCQWLKSQFVPEYFHIKWYSGLIKSTSLDAPNPGHEFFPSHLENQSQYYDGIFFSFSSMPSVFVLSSASVSLSPSLLLRGWK